jgi:hypothetical protein
MFSIFLLEGWDVVHAEVMYLKKLVRSKRIFYFFFVVLNRNDLEVFLAGVSGGHYKIFDG